MTPVPRLSPACPGQTWSDTSVFPFPCLQKPFKKYFFLAFAYQDYLENRLDVEKLNIQTVREGNLSPLGPGAAWLG